MAFDTSPSRLEAAFIQRDTTNSWYEQINITGSDLIIYLDENGKINADKISVWATKYGIGTGGGIIPGGSYNISASYASSSLSSSYALSASNAKTSSYSLGGNLPYDGNRAIKRNDPNFVGINVGGTNLEQFIENFFFPYIPATISINSSTLNYETGSTQNISLNGSITANDETLFNTGSIKTYTYTVANIPSASTYSTTDTGVSSSTVYRTYFSCSNNGSPTIIVSSTKTVNFNYPFLYGTSSDASLNNLTLYTGLLKDYASTSYTNKTYSFIGGGTYIYFAYPNSYPNLVTIKDPNNFEILASFQETLAVEVTSSVLVPGWKNRYKVYRLILPASPNGNFTFNFS
jgi:hypothetical protein